MNRQERVVVLLLAATLLVGAGILQYRRIRLKHAPPLIVLCPSPTLSDSSVSSTPEPVDLNQATQRQLDVLPGIGPVLAGRIIEYRQRHGGFRSVSELRTVSGIGPKRYASLKDLVVVGSSGSGTASDSGR